MRKDPGSSQLLEVIHWFASVKLYLGLLFNINYINNKERRKRRNPYFMLLMSEATMDFWMHANIFLEHHFPGSINWCLTYTMPNNISRVIHLTLISSSCIQLQIHKSFNIQHAVIFHSHIYQDLFGSTEKCMLYIPSTINIFTSYTGKRLLVIKY